MVADILWPIRWWWLRSLTVTEKVHSFFLLWLFVIDWGRVATSVLKEATTRLLGEAFLVWRAVDQEGCVSRQRSWPWCSYNITKPCPGVLVPDQRGPCKRYLCAWMQRRKWNIYFTCVQCKYYQVNTNCVIVQVLCCVAPIASTGCCEGNWASHIWRASIWSSSTAIHSSFHTMTGFNIVLLSGWKWDKTLLAQFDDSYHPSTTTICNVISEDGLISNCSDAPGTTLAKVMRDGHVVPVIKEK